MHLLSHNGEIVHTDVKTRGVAMVIDRAVGPEMFLEPFTKSPCQFTYALLLATHLVTLGPADYPTLLSDLIPVFGSHKEISDGVASFKMFLDPNLATYILEAVTKPLDVWDHHVDVTVFVITIVVSLVYVVVVLGLITNMSVAIVGLKSV